MTIEELEALPIIGTAHHDRELIASAHEIIVDRAIPRAIKLRALAVIDRAVGGTGLVSDLDLANYLEETL